MGNFSERQITFFFGALLVVIGVYSFISNIQFDYLSKTSHADWERVLGVQENQSPVQISFGKLVSGNGVSTLEMIVEPKNLPRAHEFPGMATLVIDSIKSKENRELFDPDNKVNHGFFQKLRFQKHVSGEIKAKTVVWLLPLKEGEVANSFTGKVTFEVPIDVERFDLNSSAAGQFLPTKELSVQFTGLEENEAHLKVDIARCLNQLNPSNERIGCEDLNKIFKIIGVGPKGELATYKGMNSANGAAKYKFDRKLSRIILFIAKKFEQFNLPVTFIENAKQQ